MAHPRDKLQSLQLSDYSISVWKWSAFHDSKQTPSDQSPHSISRGLFCACGQHPGIKGFLRRPYSIESGEVSAETWKGGVWKANGVYSKLPCIPVAGEGRKGCRSNDERADTFTHTQTPITMCGVWGLSGSHPSLAHSPEMHAPKVPGFLLEAACLASE